MPITHEPTLAAPLSPTSSGDLFQAIWDLWDQSFIPSPFTEVFRDRMPPTVRPQDIGHPYVIILTPTNRRRERTNYSEYWEHLVTFKVYDATHELCEQWIGEIGNAFDDSEKELSFLLQPEGESQSSGSDQSQMSSGGSEGGMSSESAGLPGFKKDQRPAAGTILLVDRMTEMYGEEDRVVRFGAIIYRIERGKARRGR